MDKPPATQNAVDPDLQKIAFNKPVNNKSKKSDSQRNQKDSQTKPPAHKGKLHKPPHGKHTKTNPHQGKQTEKQPKEKGSQSPQPELNDFMQLIRDLKEISNLGDTKNVFSLVKEIIRVMKDQSNTNPLNQAFVLMEVINSHLISGDGGTN